MMFRCESCGNLFEEGEQATWEETHGLDSPPYEKFSGCPLCKGDYEEAYLCKVCDGWVVESELQDGCCEACVEALVSEYRYDVEKCYELSRESGEIDSVEIDAFLSEMFTLEQINEILYRELLSASKQAAIDCSAFIEADRSWFAENVIAKEVER